MKYRIVSITFTLSLFLSMNASAADPSRHSAMPIDPATVDLTEPTLFIVPYTHLDDIWRWNYPTAIQYFLLNTLDENFQSFEHYPNFKFNWTGAARYAQMKEYYPETI